VIGGNTTKDGLGKAVDAAGGRIFAYQPSLIRRMDNFLNYRVPALNIRLNNPFVRYDFAHTIKRIRPDLIQFESLFLAHQGSQVAKKWNVPTILEMHNIEHIRLVEEGTVDPKQAETLKLFERNVCNSVDCVITFSQEDKRRLAEIGVHRKIEVVPNGVDYVKYQITEETRQSMREKYGIGSNQIVLVFHGMLKYRPTQVANTLLVNTIFPELTKRYRNLRLLLIGPGHPKEISKQIIQLPSIPSSVFIQHLSMGDIGVVPLLAGSGTRTKIIEYLALGIPTVSTEIGAEGLPVTNGENILIAKDEKISFVQETIKLIENRELRERLKRNGKRLVRENLDLSAIYKSSLKIYEDLTLGKKDLEL